MHDKYFDHEPRGEFKGDFSRDSFDPIRHFSQVLMQQGRVQLDADWNEQVSILLHYMRTLAADLVGPYAGPIGSCGFEINDNGVAGDFSIGRGRYYVNGILCENEGEASYLDQPDLPGLTELTEGRFFVYLDVWERHVSWVEDDRIREKALGGADTATRAKVVWQVKVKGLDPEYPAGNCTDGINVLDEEHLAISSACLRARAKQDNPSTDPCLVNPEAGYRGPENQLYRVEVHSGSKDEHGDPVTPTFKWSRENGSVVFPIVNLTDSETVTLELGNAGRDERFGLCEGDWVEIVDDVPALNLRIQPLLKVMSIDTCNREVTLQKKRGTSYSIDLEKHPLLRRWDQTRNVTDDGVSEFTESDDWDKNWLELEDGIKIQFKPVGEYRSGDFWLIPARTAIGDVQWPVIRNESTGEPEIDAQGNPISRFMPPHGVMHYFAPLAIIHAEENGTVSRLYDCRCSIRPMSCTCAYSYAGQMGIGVDLICPEEM